MKFRRRVGAEEAKFQMAPLIDIVFLLLVFFISTITYERMQTVKGINLPLAGASQDITKNPNTILINVRRNGAVILAGGVKVPAANLPALLRNMARKGRNAPVIIRGDKKTRHKYIVAVVEACSAAGLWNLSFATYQKED